MIQTDLKKAEFWFKPLTDPRLTSKRPKSSNFMPKVASNRSFGYPRSTQRVFPISWREFGLNLYQNSIYAYGKKEASIALGFLTHFWRKLVL